MAAPKKKPYRPALTSNQDPKKAQKVAADAKGFAASMASARDRGMMPSQAKTGMNRITDAVQGQVDQVTGRKSSAISRAMRNPTPVIPLTQRNVAKAKAAAKRR